MKLKSGAFLIVASVVVGVLAAVPMVFNRDDTLLLPGTLLSGILFLAGIVSIFRHANRKVDTKQMPPAGRDS